MQPACCVCQDPSSGLSLLMTGIKGVLQVKSEYSGRVAKGRRLHACSKHTMSGESQIEES
jgi:hypothetical protein